jgi:polyisoprenoid-binding protein YceI
MTPTPPSRRGPILGAAALVAAVAIGAGAGAWYLFFRPAGPPPVSLATLAPASIDPGAPAATSPGEAPGDLSGTWTVDVSNGSPLDGTGTFVGYRVQEQLATIGATEAVGRTADVTGTVTIAGTTVTAAELTADLTALRSDESNRDRQLSRQALETSRFPTASFSLTKPIEIGAIPADGAVVDLSATGDLTLHGVTRSVQVPLQARLQGATITIAGSLPITFADWGIQPPQAMIVLSVEDHGTMELQLELTRG